MSKGDIRGEMGGGELSAELVGHHVGVWRVWMDNVSPIVWVVSMARGCVSGLFEWNHSKLINSREISWVGSWVGQCEWRSGRVRDSECTSSTSLTAVSSGYLAQVSWVSRVASPLNVNMSRGLRRGHQWMRCQSMSRCLWTAAWTDQLSTA